jgi:hypothetical protein
MLKWMLAALVAALAHNHPFTTATPGSSADATQPQ